MEEKNFLGSNRECFVATFSDCDSRSVDWSFWHTAAIVGLVGAIIAFAVGFDLTCYAWFTGQSVNVSNAGQIGTWMFVAFFLLLIIGGCSLGEVTEIEKKQKAKLKKQKRVRQ